MRAAEGPGRLGGRVVIVTGGANGIGRAYCTALAAEGATVVVADLDGAGAAGLAAELEDGAPAAAGTGGGPRALAVETDVTSPESTERLVGATLGAYGRVDVLVNNAGTYPHESFASISYERWRQVVSQNLDSVFLCSKAVMGPMTERGGGKIVNVATNLVWTGLADMAHYIAAKAGVVGLTRALARELGASGITVNAVAPGAVPPPARLSAEGQARIDQIVAYQCVKRPERPDDLTGMMVFLCSGESDFVSGQVFTVDGGLTTH